MAEQTKVATPRQVAKTRTFCGYLRRVGTGFSLPIGKQRFYRLDGALFSKHPDEYSPASWHINIEDAHIAQVNKTTLSIAPHSSQAGANKDLVDDNLYLQAKTEEACIQWLRFLRDASTRKLADFYALGPCVGAGGFAKVYLGKCLASDEMRAIKKIQKTSTPKQVLGTEIAILKKVKHPNVVETYDVFETDDEIQIVMEYMEGGMLYEAIEDGFRFKEADIVQFMRELLDGLMYLHQEGIVHRDIKPENVLCTSRKPPLHVKIADFGLSSMTSVADMKTNRAMMSTLIGTPEFIAPEIARQQKYTEKIDMWAVGMLCYNVIAGRLPLDDKSDMILQLRKGIKLTFPEKEWRAYSPLARSFVRSLLCDKAEKRLTPLGCLVHRWLDDRSWKSTLVAPRGRMSIRLFHNEPSARLSQLTDPAQKARLRWRMTMTAITVILRLCRGNEILRVELRHYRAVPQLQDLKRIAQAARVSGGGTSGGTPRGEHGFSGLDSGSDRDASEWSFESSVATMLGKGGASRTPDSSRSRHGAGKHGGASQQISGILSPKLVASGHGKGSAREARSRDRERAEGEEDPRQKVLRKRQIVLKEPTSNRVALRAARPPNLSAGDFSDNNYDHGMITPRYTPAAKHVDSYGTVDANTLSERDGGSLTPSGIDMDRKRSMLVMATQEKVQETETRSYSVKSGRKVGLTLGGMKAPRSPHSPYTPSGIGEVSSTDATGGLSSKENAASSSNSLLASLGRLIPKTPRGMKGGGVTFRKPSSRRKGSSSKEGKLATPSRRNRKKAEDDAASASSSRTEDTFGLDELNVSEFGVIGQEDDLAAFDDDDAVCSRPENAFDMEEGLDAGRKKSVRNNLYAVARKTVGRKVVQAAEGVDGAAGANVLSPVTPHDNLQKGFRSK